jgi:nitrate reductase NapE component
MTSRHLDRAVFPVVAAVLLGALFFCLWHALEMLP